MTIFCLIVEKNNIVWAPFVEYLDSHSQLCILSCLASAITVLFAQMYVQSREQFLLAYETLAFYLFFCFKTYFQSTSFRDGRRFI